MPSAPGPAGPPDETGAGPGPARLVVVRHGATAWSLAGRHTGRTDLPLVELGVRQAEAVGRRLRGARFALVLTSPMARARQTCALAGFGDVAETTDDLREWDYGAYEGRTTEEILAERPGWSLWRDGAPGGEDLADVAGRAERVIATARAAPGDVLAFAHGHLLRVLGACWTGRDPGFGAVLMLDAGSLSVLGYERAQAAVRCWNDVADHPPV
ncbi:MAG TPA: histidine phosphatase family protein [Acidimicrobiales bacterium]|nr:histidine phosphatase family protein [Acidimicrobiales bacterium]